MYTEDEQAHVVMTPGETLCIGVGHPDDDEPRGVITIKLAKAEAINNAPGSVSWEIEYGDDAENLDLLWARVYEPRKS